MSIYSFHHFHYVNLASFVSVLIKSAFVRFSIANLIMVSTLSSHQSNPTEILYPSHIAKSSVHNFILSLDTIEIIIIIAHAGVEL